MLEIPEAATMARQLTETLTGRTIESAVAGHSPHGFAWYFGNPAEYGENLTGRTVAGARSFGGHVELLLSDDWRIDFHDGVNIRRLEPGAKRPAKHQFLIEFDDDSALVCTVQMYGAMSAFPDGALVSQEGYSYYEAAELAPSPLTDAFDRAHFDSIVAEAPAKLSAKGLLAAGQRIPGLGNGTLQDILYVAEVNPQSKVTALGPTEVDAVYEAVLTVLAEMTTRGGRDTEKDFFGDPGGYATILSAKTVDVPCSRCGSTIVKKAYMGGNVYFCPVCQPVLPTKR